MNIIAISDLRANLPKLINRVSEKLERLIITVSGKPKAVVISSEELESLEETAEILSVSDALEKIKKGTEDAKKGKGTPLRKFI
jgi:antitoxin YefM